MVNYTPTDDVADVHDKVSHQCWGKRWSGMRCDSIDTYEWAVDVYYCPKHIAIVEREEYEAHLNSMKGGPA